MRNFHGLKPQDILILLKLLVDPKSSQKSLSNSLSISQSEVSQGTQRLKYSKLLLTDGKVNFEASSEFLIHGFKYICPVEVGPSTVGIPTSYAHPHFKYVKYASEDILVWPHAEGKVKGTALFPFYPSLPKACLLDKKLYVVAALLEMIRSGRAREQNLAAKDLKKMIEGFSK